MLTNLSILRLQMIGQKEFVLDDKTLYEISHSGVNVFLCSLNGQNPDKAESRRKEF